jgi:hypothetical protein
MGFLLPWVRQCSDSQRRQNGGEEEVGEKKKRRMETSRANERESEGERRSQRISTMKPSYDWSHIYYLDRHRIGQHRRDLEHHMSVLAFCLIIGGRAVEGAQKVTAPPALSSFLPFVTQ